LIEADLSYTARDVFSELHRKCGGSGALSLGKMKDDIIDRLRDSGRVIMVDEAEFLPIRAIDLLRRVYDRAGVGVLFVGLPRLFEGLIRKKGDYAYILSRIGIKTVIGALSLTDVSEIVNQVAESPVEVSEAFLQQSGGNNRKLNKLLKKCLKAKEVGLRQQITPETIGQAADKLMI
jgi:DNA transposition AAA+ family ATPase